MPISYEVRTQSKAQTPLTAPCTDSCPNAATFMIGSHPLRVVVGTNITVPFLVNIGGTQEINAVDVRLTYSAALLDVVDITYASSFPIQAEETVQSGTVTMARGTTVPVYGSSVPIATITFRAKELGNADVRYTPQSLAITADSNTNIANAFGASSLVILFNIADVTSDNKVDIFDLSYLLSRYGRQTTEADLNNDGNVTITDLSILLSNYGKSAS